MKLLQRAAVGYISSPAQSFNPARLQFRRNAFHSIHMTRGSYHGSSGVRKSETKRPADA